jgi:hypothetical protein
MARVMAVKRPSFFASLHSIYTRKSHLIQTANPHLAPPVPNQKEDITDSSPYGMKEVPLFANHTHKDNLRSSPEIRELEESALTVKES